MELSSPLRVCGCGGGGRASSLVSSSSQPILKDSVIWVWLPEICSVSLLTRLLLIAGHLDAHGGTLLVIAERVLARHKTGTKNRINDCQNKHAPS